MNELFCQAPISDAEQESQLKCGKREACNTAYECEQLLGGKKEFHFVQFREKSREALAKTSLEKPVESSS